MQTAYGETVRQLAAELDRLAGWLRSRSPTWYRRAAAPGQPREDVVAELAAEYAAAGQGVEQAGDAAEPLWRRPPPLGAHVAADQLAVTGHDLVAALCSVQPEADVWTPQGRSSAEAVAANALRRLREVRRDLG